MAKTSGLGALTKRLSRMPIEVRKSVAPALDRAAARVVEAQKLLVPVDRGDLRDSIVATPGGEQTPSFSQPGGSRTVPEGSTVITAGNSKVRYPHLVEYGTAPHAQGGEFAGTEHPGTNPQPYFWPGYRLMRKSARRIVSTALNKAVKKGWNG